MANIGKVKQVICAVIDVQFDGTLPEIYNALELKRENGDTLVLSVVIMLPVKSYDGSLRGYMPYCKIY